MSNKNNNRGSVEITIVVIAATLTAACIYVGHALINDGAINRVQFSDIIRNYGLLALGAVGFPLAIWRSWIAYQQTQEALEQGKRVERQIKATEENNLALLLEKSAVLLTDEKEAKRKAGISLLRHIGLAPTQSFGYEAIELLLDYIRNFEKRRVDTDAKIKAVYYADEICIRLNYEIRLDVIIYVMTVHGAPKNIYGLRYEVCGIVDSMVYAANSYFDCTFYHSNISEEVLVKGETRIEFCKIEKLQIEGIVDFINCDFSACSEIIGMEGSYFTDCYYFAENPPSEKVIQLIGDHLTQVDIPESIHIAGIRPIPA